MIGFMNYDIAPVRHNPNAFNSPIPIENIDNVKARWNNEFSNKDKIAPRGRCMTVGQLIEGLMRGMNEGYINAHSPVKVNNRNVINLQINDEMATIIV